MPATLCLQVRLLDRAYSNLGVGSANATNLKQAPERLRRLRTREGDPILPNALAELRRDITRKLLWPPYSQRVISVEDTLLLSCTARPSDLARPLGRRAL